MLWWMTVSLMGYLKSHHALKQEAILFIRWSSSQEIINIIGIFFENSKKREVQIWQYI